MIPMIEREVVERNGWISKEEFLDLLAISQAAPGVFAVNISIFIGYKLKKTFGWAPVWDVETAVRRTVEYARAEDKEACAQAQISEFLRGTEHV